MPPLYRIAELALYSLLNFLPFLVLALYPFRDQFRFPKPITYLLIGAVSLVQILLGELAAFSSFSSGLLSLASTALYAIFYFFAVKAVFGKTLFTLLMLSNIANLVVMTAKCLEGVIFGDIAYESYRITFSLCMIAVHLLITFPLFIYFRKFFADGINKKSGRAAWTYLWLIPATFYLIWHHHIYGSAESSLEIALQPQHILFLTSIDLGSFLIYHMVICMINAQDKSAALEEHNHQLAMQNLQYENLKERIQEARQAKHDIRHHITVMDSYLQKGEHEKLRTYLQSYKKSLPDDSTIVFCEHHATNALLLYFAQIAKNHKIDYDIAVCLPENIKLPENVLSVVFGNLLENAVEACIAVTDRMPKIIVRAKTEDDALLITVENTFNGELIRDKNGTLLSTKHEGRGIGISSVRNIAETYNGFFDIEQNNDMFCTSLLLHFC